LTGGHNDHRFMERVRRANGSATGVVVKESN